MSPRKKGANSSVNARKMLANQADGEDDNQVGERGRNAMGKGGELESGQGNGRETEKPDEGNGYVPATPAKASSGERSSPRGKRDGKKTGTCGSSLQSRTRRALRFNENADRTDGQTRHSPKENDAVVTRSRGKGIQAKEPKNSVRTERGKPGRAEPGMSNDGALNSRDEAKGTGGNESDGDGDGGNDEPSTGGRREEDMAGSEVAVMAVGEENNSDGSADGNRVMQVESNEEEKRSKSSSAEPAVEKNRPDMLELQRRLEFDRLHRDEPYSPTKPGMGEDPHVQPNEAHLEEIIGLGEAEGEVDGVDCTKETAEPTRPVISSGGVSSAHPETPRVEINALGADPDRRSEAGGNLAAPSDSLRTERRHSRKDAIAGRNVSNVGFSRPDYLLKRNSNTSLSFALDSWGVVSGKHQANPYTFRQRIGVTTVKPTPGLAERPRANPFSQIRIVTEKMKEVVRNGLCDGGQWRWAASSGSLMLLTFADEADFSVTNEDVEEGTVIELEYLDRSQNLHRVIYLMGDPPQLSERDYICRISTSSLFYYKEGRRPVIPGSWVDEVSGSVRIPNGLRLGVVDGMVRLTVINEEHPDLEVTFIVWVVPPEQMSLRPSHMTEVEWLAPFVQFQARHSNRISTAVGRNSFVQEMLGIAKQRSTSADSKIERMTVVPRAWFSEIRDSEDYNLVDPVVRTHVGFWRTVEDLIEKGDELGRINVLSPALTKYRSERKGCNSSAMQKGWIEKRPCPCWDQLEYPKHLPRVCGLLPTVDDLKSTVYVDWVPRNEGVIGWEVDIEMDASEVLAGESLPAEMSSFAHRCVPEKAPALDMYTSRNIDNLFVMGRIQFEENDLVHRCLSCYFDDYFIAHDQASTWGIEMLMERERLRRDGAGAVETFDAMLSVDGVKSGKGRARVAMRELFPAIYFANSPTFRKKVAVSLDELIRNAVFTIERQVMESEFYSFAVVAAYHRLDGQVEYLRKKDGESTTSKPVQVGGYRMRKKKGTPRVHPTVVGHFYRLAVPGTAGAQFNFAMEVGVNAARVACRLVYCFLGLRSLACVVRNSRCPEQANRKSYTDPWSFFAGHGWLRMPDGEAVQSWGSGHNPTLRAMSGKAMEEVLFRQYDEAMLNLIYQAFDDIMGLIGRVLRTDEFDFDFWAAQEQNLRPDPADRLYVGGDMFDLELYQILERHAERMGKGKWDSMGLPFRILRSLYGMRLDEMNAKGACSARRGGENRVERRKDMLRSLSTPIVLRDEVGEERLPMKECMKNVHALAKFLKDGVRSDLKGGVRSELRKRLSPTTEGNPGKRKERSEGNGKAQESAENEGEVEIDGEEVEAQEAIDWRERKSGVDVVMDSLQEILMGDDEEGKQDKVLELMVNTVDLVKSCTRKSKVNSAQLKDTLSRVYMQMNAKESAEGQGMVMMRHCATDPITKDTLRKETASRGGAALVIEAVGKERSRPKRKRVPTAKALASQRPRSSSPKRSQSLTKRRRVDDEEVIPDTQGGSDDEGSSSQYSSLEGE